ncbi:Vacuolar protein sorting/targeting protein 10 [Penicillium chermesinum]|nr:Vacuolar protein sorting/targeting protein 10 [Penicillium chermesinum]
MIPRWLLLVVGLLLAWTAQPTYAKGDKPKATATELNYVPLNLFYFEGTNTVLFNDIAGTAQISYDGGEKWEIIKGDDGSMEGAVEAIIQHPQDNARAYVVGRHGKHWATNDQGKSWTSFKLEGAPMVAGMTGPFSFNGWDARKAIFTTMGFNLFGGWHTEAFYTVDDFKTVQPLREMVYECSWAAGTAEFGKDLETRDGLADRILCVVPGLKAIDNSVRLIYSDDFFSDVEGTEVNLNPGRPVSGKEIKLRAVKKYIVAGVQSKGTTELALFISDDSKEWHRAEFGGHRIEQDAFTLLESTNYSIQVDVQTTWDDNRHTNRDENGLVDFEKIANIQGIVLVNTVKNWEKVGEPDNEPKTLVTKISFDDGSSFQSLKVGDDQLHLHSMTTYDKLHKLAGLGRIFSSPAPGLVMGVGNTGDSLKEYSKGDLFVSNDAGLTWRKALEGPHRFEFGDQGGIIVAVSDDEKTDKVKYSIDQGKTWEKIELKHKVRPAFLTTTPDSTSLKFLLVGYSGDKEDRDKYTVYSLDFEGLHERKCSKDDLEIWSARVDENGKPDCLMGHKQSFQRRKANADCFIKEEFKLDPPIFEQCDCTAEDFECDYNFKRSEDRKECLPAVPLPAPEGKCKDPKDTYKGPSGWRLIPGNACRRNSETDLDREIERSCGNSTSSPVTDGKVHAGEPQYFAHEPSSVFYLERQSSNSGGDETIFMLNNLKLYVSHDHGKRWEQPSSVKDVEFMAMTPHPHFSDCAYFLTTGDYIYSTIDRGYAFRKFKKPTKGVSLEPVFHKKYQDWVLWIGSDDECTGSTCPLDAYWSKNRGSKWHLMLHGVGSCRFGWNENRNVSEELVFCEQYKQENTKNNRMLVSSDTLDDWSGKKIINDNIAHFVEMGEYVVVATFPTEKHEFLNVSSSIDGETFAEARFPFNIDVKLYTVLLGSPYSLFIYAAVNEAQGREYGSIVKSNSNGTYFVQSLEGVNSDGEYVDFEEITGTEGVAIANVVGNKDQVDKNGDAKKLRSVITHNDGGQWMLLTPPAKDVDGKSFDCGVTEGQGNYQCALHLHQYTERVDPGNTLYSGSAIGMLIGNGNVGEYLGNANEADTFLSDDNGITWKQVKKGRYLYEFGDAGSVVVLVREQQPTKVIHYSLDEGRTWTDFQFAETEMNIYKITTLPSDTSKNFLLWGKEQDSSKYKLATINLDFSGIWDRDCTLDEDTDENKDYYLWTPKHPAQQDNCFFGHVESYHRKKPDAHCWIGWREPHVHQVGGNCTCTRADFECDYNYEIQSDGSCGLVPGLEKPDHSLQCAENPDLIEYYEPTGYRRLPRPPVRVKEFEKKHGISGVGLFFAIVTPITVATAFGYWVCSRWDGKFGQIRLGEGSTATASFLSKDSMLLAIPVAIIAGVVAVAQSLPLLGNSLWRSISGLMRSRRGYQRPYATRGSFAARRGDYTHVVEDEDELLGADEFDEDEEA